MRENDRSERPQNRTDATFSGRSMVEMLGVLAIIGVLSVGAMSGYSKAMMKYKLNKQIGQISYILNNMIIEHEKLDRAYSSLKGSNGDMTPSFIKLGLVPEEMVSQNKTALHDVFDNTVLILSGEDDGRYFTLTTRLAQNSMDACFNLYNFAKANSADLWHVLLYTSTEDGQDDDNRIFGDKYCKYNPCLKEMTISDMDKACRACEDSLNGCAFSILYRL